MVVGFWICRDESVRFRRDDGDGIARRRECLLSNPEWIDLRV